MCLDHSWLVNKQDCSKQSVMEGLEVSAHLGERRDASNEPEHWSSLGTGERDYGLAGRGVGMVDDEALKAFGRKAVRVRVPPPAGLIYKSFGRLAQRLAHYVDIVGATGSNPVPPMFLLR